jgi:hypothetical protein
MLPTLLYYPLYKLILKINRSKSVKYYYYLPNTNKWYKGGKEFRKALSELGLTEQNWYNRWILNKNYQYKGPKCSNPSCNNLSGFYSLIVGYKTTCCRSCHNKVISNNPDIIKRREDSMKEFRNEGGPISRVLRNPNLFPKSYDKLLKWYSSGGTFGRLNSDPGKYPNYLEYSTKEWCSKISNEYYSNIGNSLPSLTKLSKFHSGWINSKKSDRAFYRSSWEAILMMKLEDDDYVKYYKSEPFSIEYEMSDGSVHRYIPDLLVEFVDGTKILVEVKADYLRNDEIVIIKEKAALKYCLENNMDYIILTWFHLEFISFYMKYLNN